MTASTTENGGPGGAGAAPAAAGQGAPPPATAGGGAEIEIDREDLVIARLAAIAIGIHVMESALPMPLPGLKPGFANIVTIVVLQHFGWRVACWVALLRIFAGSIALGTFLSPTFMLSLAGALSSMAALRLASWPLPARVFGPLGYAVLASAAHMTGQFLVAYALFVPVPGMLQLLPFLLSFSLVTGVVTGIISCKLLRAMPETAK